MPEDQGNNVGKDMCWEGEHVGKESNATGWAVALLIVAVAGMAHKVTRTDATV